MLRSSVFATIYVVPYSTQSPNIALLSCLLRTLGIVASLNLNTISCLLRTLAVWYLATVACNLAATSYTLPHTCPVTTTTSFPFSPSPARYAVFAFHPQRSPTPYLRHLRKARERLLLWDHGTVRQLHGRTLINHPLLQRAFFDMQSSLFLWHRMWCKVRSQGVPLYHRILLRSQIRAGSGARIVLIVLHGYPLVALGATSVTLLIPPKSWHMRHYTGTSHLDGWFGSDISIGGMGGKSNLLGIPCLTHWSFTRYLSSSMFSPCLSWVFCANMVWATKRTSLWCIWCMIPASSISSTLVFTHHQEIVEIHIIPYELPKCIVDGHLHYELLIIL